MHPFSIASLWTLLFIVGILQLCLAAHSDMVCFPNDSDKEIAEGILIRNLEGLYMNESSVEFPLDSPALTHEGALNFVVSSYLQKLLNDSQAISHIISKVLGSLEKSPTLPSNYSELPFELIANKMFVDLVRRHESTPLILRLVGYLERNKKFYADVVMFHLANINKKLVKLEGIVAALKAVQVANFRVFKVTASIFKNELVSKLTSYTSGSLKDYNQIFSHFFDIEILEKEMSTMNINVGLSLFSSGLTSLPVFIALDEVFGDKLLLLIESKLNPDASYFTAELAPAIYSYFFARLLRNPSPSQSVNDFLCKQLPKAFPDIRFTGRIYKVESHMYELPKLDFLLMISNVTPDLFILSASKIHKLQQRFDNFGSILVDFLNTLDKSHGVFIPVDETNSSLKMGSRMAILWGTIHQRIDPLDRKRVQSLLAELSEDAIQYFPDFICLAPVRLQITMDIVRSTMDFLGGKNSDILAKCLIRRLQDNSLEPDPMSSIKWRFNTLDSLITNGCPSDDVAKFLLKVLNHSKGPDAIASFALASETFVDFLSKYKHKELFTAFVEYLEFYLEETPRVADHKELIYLVDLQYEYQDKQDWASCSQLSRIISCYEVTFKHWGLSIDTITINPGYNAEESVASQYIQLMLVRDHADILDLLLLLEKLEKFIDAIDLRRIKVNPVAYQLLNFLNHYKNLMADDFDKVRKIVSLISKSMKGLYPHISQKLDLFIKQAQ